MEFLTNRTFEDVEFAKECLKVGWNNLSSAEQQKWLACKGYYNEQDMNRVEQNCETLKGYLDELGYHGSGSISSAKTWNRGETVTLSEFQTYCGKVANVYESAPIQHTIDLPNGEKPINYEEANNLEKALQEVNSAVNAIKSDLRICGTFRAGGSFQTQRIRR